jgi:riboflavin synthase
MFTGIIVDLGTVKTIDKAGDWRVRIETALPVSTWHIGDSICCNGVCLTAIALGDDWFEIQASQETLQRTTMGTWQTGTRVNLESSLKMGDTMGGHFVFGHVDSLATVQRITNVGDSHEVVVKVPTDLAPFFAEKGSAAFDGISLTINKVIGDEVFLMIIPHTWDVTNFGTLQVGQKLNLEVDMLARYVARQLDAQTNKKDTTTCS